MNDVKLTWQCDGKHDTFNIYRSLDPIFKSNLPTPIATNIKTFEYLDTESPDRVVYYAVGNSNYLSDSLQTERMNYERYMKSLGPVAWYKMDEDSSETVVKDSSGNDIHASYRAGQGTYHLFKQTPLRKDSIGSMGFNIGYPGQYAGGVPQCIAPADPRLYNLTKGSFSICFWAKRNGNSTFWHTLTQCGDPFSGRNSNFRVISNMYLQIEENARSLSPGSLADNELAFYCFCYDTINQLYYAYKNNNKTVGTYIANTGGGRAVTTHFPAYYDWNYYGFKGYMSDVAMFDKALTDQEVLSLYEYGRLN